MSILEGCRGPHKTPIPEERRCPACGEEVEVFTVRERIIAGMCLTRKSRTFLPPCRRFSTKRRNVRRKMADPV